MYESIRGILKEKQPNLAILECAGIAYRISIPLSTYTRLPNAEKELHLFLSYIVREDAHTLYGFYSRQERDLFETLLSISGIGPKTAAAIIGHMDADAFQRAILSADTRLLSKLPGIGKKTAERLVIEMRDKFKGKGKDAAVHAALSGTSASVDATHALINLGYDPKNAIRAVEKAMASQSSEPDLGALIALALQHI